MCARARLGTEQTAVLMLPLLAFPYVTHYLARVLRALRVTGADPARDARLDQDTRRVRCAPRPPRARVRVAAWSGNGVSCCLRALTRHQGGAAAAGRGARGAAARGGYHAAVGGARGQGALARRKGARPPPPLLPPSLPY